MNASVAPGEAASAEVWVSRSITRKLAAVARLAQADAAAALLRASQASEVHAAAARTATIQSEYAAQLETRRLYIATCASRGRHNFLVTVVGHKPYKQAEEMGSSRRKRPAAAQLEENRQKVDVFFGFKVNDCLKQLSLVATPPTLNCTVSHSCNDCRRVLAPSTSCVKTLSPGSSMARSYTGNASPVGSAARAATTSNRCQLALVSELQPPPTSSSARWRWTWLMVRLRSLRTLTITTRLRSDGKVGSKCAPPCGITRRMVKHEPHYGKSGCDGNLNIPKYAIEEAIKAGLILNPTTRELALFIAEHKLAPSIPKHLKPGWEAVDRYFCGYIWIRVCSPSSVFPMLRPRDAARKCLVRKWSSALMLPGPRRKDHCECARAFVRVGRAYVSTWQTAKWSAMLGGF